MNLFSLSIAFLVTLISILLLRPAARKLRLVDTPGGRKAHVKETPLIGGLGIYLGLASGIFVSPEVIAQYQVLLWLTGLLLVTGLIDDYYPLPPVVRLGIQVLTAWIMCTKGDNQLISLGHLFSEKELYLGHFTMVVTIFATVGVINAINMIDGMDGLSSGLVLICLGFLVIAASISGNNPTLLSLALLVSASLLAFMLLNFRAPIKRPALIYLGDSGSTMLGFVLAWLLIESSQNASGKIIPATIALWFIAIPLMDTVFLFIARPLTGKSPFEPGTDHLHHLLELHGISRTKVVLLLHVAGIVLGGAGLVFFIVPAIEKMSVYFFLGVFVLYVVLMRFEKSTLSK